MLRILIAVPFVLALALFAVSNPGPIRIGVWPTASVVTVPLSLAVLVVAGVFFVLGGLFTWVGAFATRRRARRAERTVRRLEALVAELTLRDEQSPPVAPRYALGFAEAAAGYGAAEAPARRNGQATALLKNLAAREVRAQIGVLGRWRQAFAGERADGTGFLPETSWPERPGTSAASASGVRGLQQGWGSIGLDDDLPKAFEDDYWQTVRRVLMRVFGTDPQRADQLRERLRQLQSSPGVAAPRAIFYHASPFDVAADLAGRAPQDITAEQHRAYFEMMGRRDAPPDPAAAWGATS